MRQRSATDVVGVRHPAERPRAAVERPDAASRSAAARASSQARITLLVDSGRHTSPARPWAAGGGG
ncbi:hypothetical protein [Micromonospora deserti]|uniref:Uncharacterized protein n=1 Tax=Micromonospora deserti TaxID=2070366 RepID=A0A2W2BRL5_9ACTN|nr:hypothetical protein [Micromonospora deserti]PZF89931.1 hypothetical protein C1I99_24995 [Micromonospora deserti]